MREAVGDESPFDEIGGVVFTPEMKSRLSAKGLGREACKSLLRRVAKDDNSVTEPINWSEPPPEMPPKPQ
jgi:hypothetical protein